MYNLGKYTQKQILIFEGVMTLLRDGRKVHELKVADITEAAGIGKSTAYEYFSSKEEIIKEALAYHLEQKFMELSEFVFKETTYKGMVKNALDYLERSIEERFNGIFLMILTEKHENAKTCSYMDEKLRSKMEYVVTKQIQKAVDIGKSDGQIGKEMSIEEVRMASFGFFMAYVHELIPLKIKECRVEKAKVSEEQNEEDIINLKERTLKLLLKTLA